MNNINSNLIPKKSTLFQSLLEVELQRASVFGYLTQHPSVVSILKDTITKSVSIKQYDPFAELAQLAAKIPLSDPYMHLNPNDRQAIAREVVTQLKDRKIQNRRSYPLPQNATWTKLYIKFIDGHAIKVKYPGMPTGTFDYKDLGFENHKNYNPDVKWKFLQVMSEIGSITNSKYNRLFNRTVKYETAERLKKFFGLSDNPFYPYTKKDGYRPRFCLLSEADQNSLDAENVIE